MKHKGLTFRVLLALVLVLLLALPATVGGQEPPLDSTTQSWTYTTDADFAQGTLVNVNYDDVPDQLQLDSEATAFDFIWVAVSSKGTVVKINTKTGAVLGEYLTAPAGMGTNPSRTTVDNNGNVWVANRNESGYVTADAIAPGVPPVNRYMGSAVYIGLEEAGQCVDRNSNGVIDTSTGLGDIRGWTNAGAADTLGGVSTAADECVINYVRVNSTGTRHVSVDANNDVWISGTGGRYFDLIDDVTGAIIRQEPPVGYGGYGGLIDGNGVIWSARSLLRWNTALPLTIANSTVYSHDSYGLCIDSQGNVWNTSLGGNIIRKFNPGGALIGTYSHGDWNSQGCVVDQNDHVWVAHSLYSGKNTVGHLLNDGTFIGNVTLDPSTAAQPTGVAVDGDNNIWATGYNSHKVYRIDPAAGPIGGDGVTPIGAVDFTSVNLGGVLYNYSDMTGSTLIAPPNTGTWTVIHDSGIVGAEWRGVSWNSNEPGDSSITVKVAASADGVTFGPEVPVPNDSDPGVQGQYLKVIVSFSRASTGETPILYDLTIHTNQPPTADPNGPYVFPLEAGPFDGSGSYDPDDDPLTYAWDFGDSSTGTGATPSHIYTDAGIYDVCLTVDDGLAQDTACTYAVVYDPSAGFVTGGGWIDSPTGAYKPDESLTGKATFGFVSKYKKGATVPTGNTEFQFHAADLNFHSSSYEWLVVTGSNYARFKGVGTINGEGSYKFLLWAGDDDPDTFRIKIWEEDESENETVIYDNGFDQELGSGSIIIHTKKK